MFVAVDQNSRLGLRHCRDEGIHERQPARCTAAKHKGRSRHRHIH